MDNLIIAGLGALLAVGAFIYELNRRDRKRKKFDVMPPFDH